jgi:hypothetical protein
VDRRHRVPADVGKEDRNAIGGPYGGDEGGAIGSNAGDGVRANRSRSSLPTVHDPRAVDLLEDHRSLTGQARGGAELGAATPVGRLGRVMRSYVECLSVGTETGRERMTDPVQRV